MTDQVVTSQTAYAVAERDERVKVPDAFAEYERRRCETSFYDFFRCGWMEFYPDIPFEDNWHVKYLCDIAQAEMERIFRGDPKSRDYIINISPRSLKSLIFSVFLNAWVWGPLDAPWIKFISSSHNKDLSITLCLNTRRLIECAWYQAHWGDRFEIVTDQNTKANFENNRKGMRKATSTGSGIYGSGAHVIINDDPQDPETAESEVERETVKRHYGRTLFSRLDDQKLGLRINIQQRLHDDDLTGHLIRNNPEEYYHICIPAVDSEDVKPAELRKFYVDGLFFPSRFGRDFLRVAKLPTNMGEYGFAGQYLQRPSPPEGGTFKRTWWRFWQPAGSALPRPVFKDNEGKLIPSVLVTLPADMERVVDSWDTALDGLETSDDVCGQKWGKKGANKYILDWELGKFNYPETKRRLVKLYEADSKTTTVIIERSSNGPAVAADLREQIPGIITIPTGKRSKVDRVKISDTVPYQAQVESGNIYLPHPDIDPRVHAFIEEHALFPKVAQDGQVDSAQQAVNFLTTKKHVWPFFNPANKACRDTFSMVWPSNGFYHYGAVVIGDDMSVSVVTANYNKRQNTLYVYGELVAKEMAMDTVAKRIVAGMGYKDKVVHGLFGNKKMFSSAMKSSATTLNNQIRNHAVSIKAKSIALVQQAEEYDPLGTMNLANLMFHEGEIVIHESAVEMSRQAASWYLEDGRPKAQGFELCECLCLIVSAVNRHIPKKQGLPKGDPHYKKVKTAQKKDKRKRNNSWQIG